MIQKATYQTTKQNLTSTTSVLVLPEFSKQHFRNVMMEHYEGLIAKATNKEQREFAINGYNSHSPIPLQSKRFIKEEEIIKPIYATNY